MPPAVIAGAGLVYGIYSSKKQADAAKKSSKKRQEALRKQEKIASVKAARERVQNIREARRRRASIVAGAAGGDVLGSSGAKVGSGNVVSQLASNLAFSQGIQDLGGEASALNISAAGHASDAASFGAQASLGASIFSSSESLGKSVSTMWKMIK